MYTIFSATFANLGLAVRLIFLGDFHCAPIFIYGKTGGMGAPALSTGLLETCSRISAVPAAGHGSAHHGGALRGGKHRATIRREI